MHSQICSNWLESLDSGSVVFCRVSQMGLLRLLTSKSVMDDEVLSSRDAWRAYQKILTGERISFAPEPFTLEPEWQKLAAQDRPTPKVWTDPYLAAFTRASGMRSVTLDRAVLSLADEALLLK